MVDVVQVAQVVAQVGAIVQADDGLVHAWSEGRRYVHDAMTRWRLLHQLFWVAHALLHQHLSVFLSGSRLYLPRSGLGLKCLAAVLLISVWSDFCFQKHGGVSKNHKLTAFLHGLGLSAWNSVLCALLSDSASLATRLKIQQRRT